MSEIEELNNKISHLENENTAMYAALLEASNLGGAAALRCEVELQRIAREDNTQPSAQSGAAYCECPGDTRTSKIHPDICPVCEKPRR